MCRGGQLRRGHGGACPSPAATQNHGFVSQAGGACLLCHTADTSAVSHSSHVCCVTQQTCLLCHTADMSAVSDSRHVCRVTQQTYLLCHTADMSPVSYSRHGSCATQQTMPAVWQSRHCLGPKGAFWTRQQMRKWHIYI